MRRALSIPLLAACALAAAQQLPAQGERASPGAWPQHVFRWYYNPRNHPAWLQDGEARQMLQGAAQQWEQCGLRMQYEGETDHVPGAADGINVVGWRPLPGGLRGITQGRARAGRLVERDIAFSPDRAEFAREPRLLRKVMTHEFGHAIGLTHSAQCDDVMTLAADCPRVPAAQLPLTLTEHDRARCKALYGSP